MSAAKQIAGHRLRPQEMDRLPQVRRDFANGEAAPTLDPSATNDGSGDRKQDKPAPALKPPQEMRGDADRQGWLAAARDDAFARATGRDAAASPEAQPTPWISPLPSP